MQEFAITENNIESLFHEPIIKQTIDKAIKYRCRLSKEEIQQIKYIGLWKAIKAHQKNSRQSFLSVVYNCVKWEYKLFIKKHHQQYVALDLSHVIDTNVNNIQYLDASIDMNSLNSGCICYDFVINRYTFKELSQKYNISRYRILCILKKNLTSYFRGV